MAGALLALAAGASVTARADARTYVNDGTGAATFKPKAITGGSGVACGVFRTRGMRWGRWGARVARGRGVVLVNSGDPSCADGNEVAHKARFRLYRPRRNCRLYDIDAGKFVKQRKRVFTRVDIRFDGRTWKTTPADAQYC